ncbi:23S rRNA (uracil(1939)-C(5))-methyltransferase RlmD [Oscillatoriales cyanobacterium LEGE 11467]|uniref:23S rRNA (Uracil(1939)-C(5))-methyltransferase RlmD n=1 Tax=Zarconia navalis LEGE 11467 TaxID=1828826 RepID=A0A928VXU4_9CYAN|nr:23S rRNA (uracil(1939)-C(5))-methyltransferase RlmD [Zarconia navalis]MBE9040246.1 23S rRNA (uracil(1939)-C(5))-methyltransferase RlmD [Zarconia navalis LEGE 11467]
MHATNTSIASESPEFWQQGQILEVVIEDLTDTGDGVGRWNDRVVFVPDTVPGDRVLVRLVRVKRQYANGKLHELLDESPHRQRPNCIVADKCGGCQWQQIRYDCQLEAKRRQVTQTLARIGGMSEPPIDSLPVPSDELGYRNKATYPLARSSQGRVQAGYYQKGSHKLVNLNQCPVQDPRLDPLLAQVKQDIDTQGWSIYNEAENRGKLRHLSLRIGRRTGEILLTLVSRSQKLSGLEEQATQWMERYPKLVGVCLNVNSDRTNRILGSQTRCVAGRPFLHEKFGGLTFQLRSDTFFQVNTEAAEALLQAIAEEWQLTGDEVLLDAYCGIGTFTLPLATRVRQVIGLESQPSAVEQAQQNATLNEIDNVTFHQGKVKTWLKGYLDGEIDCTDPIDRVLLDPPRSGCDGAVIESLLQLRPQRIAYISCKPATLARDLKLLTSDGAYRVRQVKLADFFPQTAHVECAAFLERC